MNDDFMEGETTADKVHADYLNDLYQELKEQGLICSECNGVMDKSRIQGEIQYVCPNCGLTEVEHG